MADTFIMKAQSIHLPELFSG